MKDTWKKSFKKLAFVLLGLATKASASLYAAVVSTWAWYWFLTPLTELPPPSAIEMWGLHLLVLSIFSFARSGRGSQVVETWLRQHKIDETLNGIAHGTWSAVMTSGILVNAWILHHFFK